MKAFLKVSIRVDQEEGRCMYLQDTYYPALIGFFIVFLDFLKLRLGCTGYNYELFESV